VIRIKDNSKIMADLLRSGNTMLNLACPVCNSPLFRNKAKDIFCPICNKKVLIKKNQDPPNGANHIEKEKLANNFNIDNYSLKEIIENKIHWISQKLKNETQVDLIERYITTLLNLYELLDKITKYNASAGI